MQTRLNSLIEQLLNIGSGFLVSLGVWEFAVKPIWEIQTNFTENLQITFLFTVVSIARSYTWRRFFNWRDYNKNKKRSHEHIDSSNGPRGQR